MRPNAFIDERIQAVIVVFEPIVLLIFAVGNFALNLHPTVSKRNVLEVDKPGAHFRYGSRIVRLREVARAEFGVEQRRMQFFHTCREIYAAILDLRIQLLKPDSRGTLAAQRRLAVGIDASVVGVGGVSRNGVDAKGIAKPSRKVQIFGSLQSKRRRLALSDHATAVRHYIIRRKLTVADRSENFAGNVQRLFGTATQPDSHQT